MPRRAIHYNSCVMAVDSSLMSVPSPLASKLTVPAQMHTCILWEWCSLGDEICLFLAARETGAMGSKGIAAEL